MITNSEKFNKIDKYIIFSGIGNPTSFKKTLIKNNFNVIKEIKFPDHYDYRENDIQKIKLEVSTVLQKKLHQSFANKSPWLYES